MADMQLMADAAYKAGFTDRQQLANMIAIGMAESGGRATINNAGTNRNGTVDYGLWQINSVHRPDLDQIYDPYYNAQQAWHVFSELGQGYGAWSAYNDRKYVPFMADAVRAADKYLNSGGVSGFAVNQGNGVSPNAARGTLSPKISGREMGQQVLSSLSKMVSSRATDTRMQGEGETDDEDFNYSSTDQPAATLDTINQFVGSRLERFKQTEQAPTGVVDASAPAAETIYDGRIPQVDAAAIAEWTAKGLKDNAARAAAIARALGFEGTVHGVGARGNKSDHPDGNAVDLMTMDDLDFGWELANFFVEHAAELGLKYAIFNGKIASASRGWEWRDYTHPSGNTTNPTLRHDDHVHLSAY